METPSVASASSTPPPPIIKSKDIEIPLGGGAVETSEKTTINFQSPDYIKQFMGQSTQKAPEAPAPAGALAPADPSAFDAEDFDVIAETVIEILDTAMVTGLRWWAKDDTDAPYQITLDKKKRLIKQLSRILAKMQVKWSLEMLFVFTLVITYGTAVNKARLHRKEVMAVVRDRVRHRPEEKGPDDPADTSKSPSGDYRRSVNDKPKLKRGKGNPGRA